MLGLVLALVAAPASASPAAAGMPRTVALSSRCEQHAGVRPAVERERGAMRRLDELPPADHVLTVFRTVAGCLVPVIVRSGIGER